MKPEYIQNLREDFPDLISVDTTIDETMPDAWREAIRGMLVGIRELKFGRRHGYSGGDIHVRAIYGRVHGHGVGRRAPASRVLDVQVHSSAAAKTRRGIKAEIRYAAFRAREAQEDALRQHHLLDIVRGAEVYVRATLAAGKPVAARDVVLTSAYDDDDVRYHIPSWVVMAVNQWLKGGALGDLTATEKSRLMGILKSMR